MRILMCLIVALLGFAPVPVAAQHIPSIHPAPPIDDKENLLYLDLSTGGRVTIL
ncbi:MAG: peptidylprolyl isomerase, partial [Sphingomonas sp.]|nr:peptidylprolyl isomerase [Sphingomonas sp.]